MGSAFGDAFVLDYCDFVGAFDGGKAVGDYQGGAAFGKSVEGGLDFLFGGGVQGAGCFV